jgi:hypothetical protein
MKIKILKTFIGNVEGKSVPFKEGEIVDVPAEPAWHFINGLYAEKVDRPRTVRTKRNTKQE